MSELEVVAGTGNPEHDAVDPLMVLEAADNAKTKASTVHRLGSCQVADWPGDPKVIRHEDWAGRRGAV